jgi:hypothetical protein
MALLAFAKTRMLLLVGGIVVVLSFALLALVLFKQGGETRTSGEPASSFPASGPHYASLEELVQASDLVVAGTVQEVRPGEIEAKGTGEEIEHSETLVDVAEVLKGPGPDGPLVVETLESAFVGPNAAEWRKPGARVLLFLSPSREGTPVHILANANYSETAYLVQDGNLIDTLRGYPAAAAPTSLSEVRRAARPTG